MYNIVLEVANQPKNTNALGLTKN